MTLRSGDELRLALTSDIGKFDGGQLVFADGSERPGFLPSADVRQVKFADPLGA